VGGVLFALEEMSSWWRNNLMWLIFFTTAGGWVGGRVKGVGMGEGHSGYALNELLLLVCRPHSLMH
jgi:hypothetical protein